MSGPGLADSFNEPALLWVALIVGIGLATATGFIAGLTASPWLQQWALRRAHGRVEILCERVLRDLDRARYACHFLTTAAIDQISATQILQFDSARDDLTAVLNELATTMRTSAAGQLGSGRAEKLDWIRSPVDPATGLPDSTAFEANLQNVLAVGSRSRSPAGLLLVQIDKADALRSRIGSERYERLRSRLTAMVVRSLTEEDLACCLNDESLAVLMPMRWPLDAIRLAQQIRTAIREHRFHVDEHGPEILLTASFGFSTALPDETGPQVLDRARDALRRSRSSGRNQLHVHDGTSRQPVRLT